MRSEDSDSVREYIKQLGCFRGCLTGQQIKTLKGQALAGDLSGAVKGLRKLVDERDCVPLRPQRQKEGIVLNENAERKFG